MSKADSAAAKLRFLNPEIVVETYPVWVDETNVAGLVEGQDLIIDCTDSFESRYVINAACCEAGIDLIEGGATGWSGLVMPILPGASACYRCAFPTAPQDAPSCSEAGIIGPAAGIVGSLMALEALKLLSGAVAPLMDAFLTVDLATLDTHARHRATGARTARTAAGSLRSGCGSETIRRVSGELRRDVSAVRQRDPAATGVSTAEILTAWPGLHAVLAHRVAHALTPRASRSRRARSRMSRAR